jgi:hypothetical protein
MSFEQGRLPAMHKAARWEEPEYSSGTLSPWDKITREMSCILDAVYTFLGDELCMLKALRSRASNCDCSPRHR